ncbi:MAG TPA: hypothetical protein VGX51_02505 [Solirubrobacteraceae bacterium]|nr:hypothetical protein [Solirubrobacteraceae bacterium]
MNLRATQHAASSPKRPRLAPPTAALLVGVFVVVLAAAYITESLFLTADNHFSLLDTLLNVILALAFAGVGLVLARQQSHNPIGWLFLAGALLLMLSDGASAYTALVYRFGRRELPLGPAAVLVGLLWVPMIAGTPSALLLFPDGRLPSPRWRWIMGAYLLLATSWIACFYLVAVSTITNRHFAVNLSGDLTAQDNPTGGLALSLSHVETALQIGFAGFWLWIVGRLALSYRRAADARRQQLKCLVSGAAVTMTATVLVIFVGSQSSPSPAEQALLAVASLLLVALPVSIGVAILRYRLYEIDRLISRTLAYAILTALLVGTFVGIVAITTQLLPLSSRVGVAAATLAAAALFNPLRQRVQRLVDRRFNRARYDAEATVAAFRASLRDAVELDTIRAQLLGVVDHTFEPTNSSLWIRESDPDAPSPMR